MSKEFKESMDKIYISESIKDEIYHNIIDKANVRAVPKKNNIKYIPIALVASLAIAFFAMNYNNFDFVKPINNTDSMIRSVQNETCYVDVYYVLDEGIASYNIEECPTDPILAWGLILEGGYYQNDIILESYTQNENDITLYFSENLKDENIKQAIIKTFEQIFFGMNITIETA